MASAAAVAARVATLPELADGCVAGPSHPLARRTLTAKGALMERLRSPPSAPDAPPPARARRRPIRGPMRRSGKGGWTEEEVRATSPLFKPRQRTRRQLGWAVAAPPRRLISPAGAQDDVLRRAVAVHEAKNWRRIGAPRGAARRTCGSAPAPPERPGLTPGGAQRSTS